MKRHGWAALVALAVAAPAAAAAASEDLLHTATQAFAEARYGDAYEAFKAYRTPATKSYAVDRMWGVSACSLPGDDARRRFGADLLQAIPNDPTYRLSAEQKRQILDDLRRCGPLLARPGPGPGAGVTGTAGVVATGSASSRVTTMTARAIDGGAGRSGVTAAGR